MPFKGGAKPVGLRMDVVRRLEELKTRKRDNRKFGTWLNEYLLIKLEDSDYLSRYGPFISWIGPEGDSLLLRDYNLDRLIEVQIKDSNLYCLYHEAKECVHIGFCYAIPEVYKKLVEIGFKPLQALAKVSDKKERHKG